MSCRALVSLAVLSLLTAGCRGHGVEAPDAGPAALAPKDLNPPKKPPPVHAVRQSAPALPDLPALAAHEAPARAPTAPPEDDTLADHPCRAVWTGSQMASLACARALLFGAAGNGADPGGGAKLLVPRTLLSRDPGQLPAVADHRVDATEGPVRDQGPAPVCTAFATATAIDHAIARWSGRATPASTMQIWSRYHSPRVETSLLSNVGMPIGPEQAWPFNAREATSWIPCEELLKPKAGTCSKPIDTSKLQKVESGVLGELTEVEYLGVPPDTQMLEAKIAAGQDVMVAMELSDTFVPKGKPGARYVPHYTRSGGPDAGHALVLAGYARLPHGTYFLIHNSWGPGWGDGGYAWMHESTLTLWAREVVAIDAEPLQRDASSRPRRDRGTTACDGGLLPDSIRTTCAPACPDGSPRHDGVCAVAGQCAPGYVNLAGACVLAAPTAHGSDPATGIGWTCGPGGCAYSLPRASDPTCSGSVCAASCPAPDFHLAKMTDALVCVE